MDEGVHPERAPGTDADPLQLERAVLHRVALDRAERVERAVVPDPDQALLRDGAAVIEDPATDTDSQEPPDHVLEGRAVEHVEVACVAELPVPLVAPERSVVDRAEHRLQRPEGQRGALHQHHVADRHHRHEHEHTRQPQRSERLVAGGADRGEEEQDEHQAPPCQYEGSDRHGVVPVLGGEPGTQLVGASDVVEGAVAHH